MKLTPLDIHHKEFRNSLRGYNAEEVDAFLDEVADEFERLFKENIDLSEKLDAANEKVRSYAEIERTLHNTMLAAQSSAEDIKARASKEADSLLHDAELKAKELIQGALAEKQRIQAELMRIQDQERDFRSRFRSMLDGYAQALRESEGQTAPMDSVDEPVAAEQPAPSPAAEEDFEPPAFVRAASESAAVTAPEADVPAAPAEPAAPKPIPPFAPDLAAASQRGDRPHARAGRGLEETQPISDLPSSGFVQSLTLGEVEGPDVRPEPPVFERPPEFAFGGRAPLGERDDDSDIEQID